MRRRRRRRRKGKPEFEQYGKLCGTQLRHGFLLAPTPAPSTYTSTNEEGQTTGGNFLSRGTIGFFLYSSFIIQDIDQQDICAFTGLLLLLCTLKIHFIKLNFYIKTNLINYLYSLEAKKVRIFKQKKIIQPNPN